MERAKLKKCSIPKIRNVNRFGLCVTTHLTHINFKIIQSSRQTYILDKSPTSDRGCLSFFFWHSIAYQAYRSHDCAYEELKDEVHNR